ncbi:hypothetical protein AYI68_g6117 [Smittium mucronatum]|uniref:Uncharacterized protein n=1 Tax=Smittium mucronatum TaxID=133383 RepID=A0A1R0GSE5_9FUNG|nr:hypothetical protein AYI68_g6117 [Smittium mucronatum]
MRLLLADAASGITQSRQDLVYRTMELPEKVTKLNEEQEDSLFNSEEFDTLFEANRKARKRPVRSKDPFRQRQQVASGIAPTTAQNQQAAPTAPSSQSIGKPFTRWRLPISFSGGMVKIDRQPMGQKDCFGRFSNYIQSIIRKPDKSSPRFPAPTLPRITLQNHSAGAQFFPKGKIVLALRVGLWTNVNYTSSSSQKKDDQSRKRFDNNRSSRTIIKARDRGSKKANSWFLQSLIHNLKKDMGFKTRKNSSSKCFFSVFPQPFSLYQDTAPDNNLVTSLGNKDCVLFGRHHNIGKKPTNMPGEHQYSSIKAQRTRISDQGLKIISCTKTDHQTPENAYQLQADDSESSDSKGSRLEKGGVQIDNQGGNYIKRTSFVHWEGASNGCSTTTRTPNFEEIVGIEKQSLVKKIRLELSISNKGQCTAESELVERSTTSMEWSLIHSRSSLWDPNPTQDGGIHQLHPSI